MRSREEIILDFEKQGFLKEKKGRTKVNWWRILTFLKGFIGLVIELIQANRNNK